jgi:hypothetical protein
MRADLKLRPCNFRSCGEGRRRTLKPLAGLAASLRRGASLNGEPEQPRECQRRGGGGPDICKPELGRRGATGKVAGALHIAPCHSGQGCCGASRTPPPAGPGRAGRTGRGLAPSWGPGPDPREVSGRAQSGQRAPRASEPRPGSLRLICFFSRRTTRATLLSKPQVTACPLLMYEKPRS